jgi:DNA primase
VQVLTRDLDLDTLADKRTALDRLGPLIVQIGNQLEQSHYVQLLARMLSLDEAVLRSELRRLKQNKPVAVATATATAVAPKVATPTSTPAAPKTWLKGRAQYSAEYLLMCLMQFGETRTEVEHKLAHDMAEFPQVQQCMQGTIDELLQGDDELRAIWQAWAKAAPADLVQWINGLPEILRERLNQMSLRVQLPKEYLITNEALECVTILQREVAKHWNTRLTRQLVDNDHDTAQMELLQVIADIQQYLNRLMTPPRSSTYDDLHNRQQS